MIIINRVSHYLYSFTFKQHRLSNTTLLFHVSMKAIGYAAAHVFPLKFSYSALQLCLEKYK